MKLRLRIRHNMQPSDHSIGWKKGRPIVRLTKVQIEMAEMLGIPPNIYAKHYAQLKLGRGSMIEHKFAVWALGFAMGIMTIIGADKIIERDILPQHAEAVRADELISIYKRGVKDALKTNPVSFELEQTCLEVWASKQPVETQ
jgi:hypothetical protein